MNQLKKIFLAVAVVALGASSAWAQGVVWNATSLPRQVRVEGRTETIGEVVLLAASTGTIAANSSITIIYGAKITNVPTIAVISCSFGGVNPPSSAQCIAAGMTIPAPTSNQLVLQFPLATPITLADVIVIAQIRIDVSALGAGTTSVNATLSGTSSAPSTFPITFNQASVQVAAVQPQAIKVTFPKTADLKTLSTCDVKLVALGTDFAIKLTENFPTGMTSLLDEKGFTPDLAAGVTSGTVVTVTLKGIPSGATVRFVSYTGVSGGFNMLPAAPVDTKSTGADIVYAFTVDTANTGSVDSVTLNFLVGDATAGDIKQLGGAPIAVTADVSLTPISTATTPTPIISFTTNAQTGVVFNFSDCITRLLYSWVANVVDLDTGIAIANTTDDDVAFGAGTAIGATKQNGTCTLTGYPAAGGASISYTTPVINAGQTAAFTLSGTTVLRGFVGHVLAVCNFLDAHSFVFITNGFGSLAGPTVAQGYLANVVLNTTRVNALGESLGD
jgi:hypothetical protein